LVRTSHKIQRALRWKDHAVNAARGHNSCLLLATCETKSHCGTYSPHKSLGSKQLH